ncbi:hypothetical protein C1H46_023966 [Malus baccata]|uniref:Mediator of RNA polymerase II transcription subunit 17 n=2 Tax=Malus TaxID=3749 RepID=A0A540LVV7_MALBA|nr:hypothetical protein C1H46_023966 [Malus baccata]
MGDEMDGKNGNLARQASHQALGTTKLQCFRHLGKYFKQSAKALDRQVAREARFYGALIRLQQNWKVKRQHMAASASGNEGFTIDLFDNSVYDPAAIFRPSALSTVHDEHDSAGRLAINVPPNSFRSLQFGFLSADPADNPSESSKTKINSSREAEKESVSDDESVKDTHSLLREVHQAIFDEQVFNLVNREAFNQTLGVNVTGIQENYLQLNIGEGTSVFISLIPSKDEQMADGPSTQNIENAILPLDTLDGLQFPEDDKPDTPKKMSVIPDQISCEIYPQQDVPTSTGARVSGLPANEGSGLLGHFCMSLVHRIFSNKVLTELENVIKGVPYLQLLSQPTWHSWTSSWMLSVKIPQSLLHACQTRASDMRHVGNVAKSQFHTKVVVTDDCINLEGEDLPVIILQQVAGQAIHWLHEEALAVGIKANRDFLCLSLELDQGETLSVVPHVDPEDSGGCISWWLVIDAVASRIGRLEVGTARPDRPDNRNIYKHRQSQELACLPSKQAISKIRVSWEKRTLRFRVWTNHPLPTFNFVYFILFVLMSGGTPTGAGYMRQRHSQGYASSGDDLEDDACSVMRSPSPQSPKVWSRIEILENALWLASAAFIVYYGDRKSNMIYILCHDERIRRLPLYLGMVGVVLNIIIFFYTSMSAWSVRRFDEKWELESITALPFVTLLGGISFCFFCFALWPIWSFLTLPLLFTLFMAGMVICPYIIIGIFRQQHDVLRADYASELGEKHY